MVVALPPVCLIIDSPTIRVLCSAVILAGHRYMFGLECLLAVAFVQVSDPCALFFQILLEVSSLPIFVNGSNQFLSCKGVESVPTLY